MSNEEATLREVQAVIENLDPPDKARTEELAKWLRCWVESNGDAGVTAVALVGAEISAR